MRGDTARKTDPTVPAIILIIILAGISYWHIWRDAPFLSPDSMDYMNIAADLRDGGLDNLHYRTPGYPFLLLLANSTREPTRLLYFLQLSLRLASVLLLALFLLRLKTPRILIALFLLLSLAPPGMVSSAYALTEALTEFLLVLAAVLLLAGLERRGRPSGTLLLLGSGAACGLTAIVRPSYQLLCIPLAGAALLTLHRSHAGAKRRFSTLLATLVLPLAVIGGCSAYNYTSFGFMGLSPSFGLHLSTRTARVLERLPDEYAEVRELLIQNRDSLLVERHGQHRGVNYIWSARPELERITGLDKPGLSRYMLKLNLLLIRKAPLEYLWDVGSAAVLYWFPTTTEHSNFGSRSLQALWSGAHFLVIFAFFSVALLLLAASLLRRILPEGSGGKAARKLCDLAAPLPLFVVPISMIIYTMLVSTMFEGGHQRYRAPTDLLLYFFLVLGIRVLLDARSAAAEAKTAARRPPSS